MRKYFETMKWIMTLCLFLFLSGCSEKNAMPAEEPVSERKAWISDALSMYESEGEMYAAQTKRLAQKLVLEGQIKDEHDLIFADACQRNISYNYLYFHNYACKDESALDICYPYELYHVSLSEEGEITYYYTLLDYYVSTLDSGETVIYAGNERDEVIREVTDLSTALKQESPFKYSSPQMNPLEKTFKSGVDLIRVLENQWSTEQLARLQDPVTAAEALLLLREGNGEYFYSGCKSMVKYQFANGEEITYDMAFDGVYWRPMSCWEKDDELYPELKGITEEQKRYDMISTHAAKSITMEDIKNVVSYGNYYSYNDGILEMEIDAESFGIFGCGNVQFFTDWEKCYLIKDVSVYTEGRYGGHGQTGCFDYDGDGQNEYALAIDIAGSLDDYYENLYIFEIENDHLSVRLFNYWDVSIEPIESILPEGCSGGLYVGYELEKGQILLKHGVVFPKRALPGGMGFLQAKFMYRADGSYELADPQFEMFDDLHASVEKEKVLLQYSASELRKVKKHYKGERKKETETSHSDVVIVAEDTKADAAVYGIGDYYRDVTVLRVKDDIYRLQLNDWSIDEDRQRVLSGYDYDGDGELEYLYYVVNKDGYGDFLYMFDIVNGKVNVSMCRDYCDPTELELIKTLMAEKYELRDSGRNTYAISLKDHSIKCMITVSGEVRDNGVYITTYEKALIECDVKYGADGTFSFENPVVTMLKEQ